MGIQAEVLKVSGRSQGCRGFITGSSQADMEWSGGGRDREGDCGGGGEELWRGRHGDCGRKGVESGGTCGWEEGAGRPLMLPSNHRRCGGQRRQREEAGKEAAAGRQEGVNLEDWGVYGKGVEERGDGKRRGEEKPLQWGRMMAWRVLLVVVVLGLSASQAEAGRPQNDNKANAGWVRSLIENRTGRVTANQTGPIYAPPGGTYPPGHAGSEFIFLNFTATGSNLEATMEVDEPSHGSLETAASVWWQWVSPVNATIKVTTSGSVGDTAIAVYVPAPWDGIRVTNAFGVHAVSYGFQTDDDTYNVPGKMWSTALFTAYEGQFYYMAVGSFRGNNCSLINLLGTVESYIIPPPFIPRVADVTFSVSGALGNARNASQPLHDMYATISMACETPGAYVFYTLDLSAPKVRMLFSGELIEEPVGGSTVRWRGEPIPMDNIMVRAQAYKKGMLDSLLTSSTKFKLQSSPTRMQPDGGQHNISVLVSIFSECADAAIPIDNSALRGPGDACVVHYSTDGTEPTLASPRYTFPFPLANVSNLVVKSRLYNSRMLPSDVTTSQVFNVWMQAAAPIFTPPGTSCGLGELDTCPDHVKYDYSVIVNMSTSTPGARLFYSLDLALTSSNTWLPYLGGITFGPGVKRLRAIARKDGWMESQSTVRQFEVYQTIQRVNLGDQVQGTILPGKYNYYVTTITNVRTDITVSLNRFFGLTDILLSAYTMRPDEANLTHIFTSRAAAGEGAKLSLLHTEFDFDVDEVNGTPIYIAVLGAGSSVSQYLIQVSAETSPVVQLGMLYGGQVQYGKWTYFKFYMGQGSPGEEPMRVAGFMIEAKQMLAVAIGIRVSFKEGSRPTDASVGTTVTRGDSNGLFQLPVTISQNKAVYYVGVKGMFAISPIFNFTLSISPNKDPPLLLHSAPSRGLGPPCSLDDSGFQGGCTALDIFPGVSYFASVRSTRFSFFRITPTLAGQSVLLTVAEAGTTGGVYTGGLQLLIQQDVFPTLASFIAPTSSSTDPEAGTYSIRANIMHGHSYMLGVYAQSYIQEEYNFTVKATIFTLPSTPRPGGKVPSIFPISNNYRSFYKLMQHDTYAFYFVALPTEMDLTIQINAAIGDIDMYVSNTNSYPTASREGVDWFSLADEKLNQINVYSSDKGYKLGVYYIGVYARTYCDFGITAYLDQSATTIQMGSKYGILASTFSYRYYRVEVSKMYSDVTFKMKIEEGPQFMVALIQFGRRPTQTSFIYQSYISDPDGLMSFNLKEPKIGSYFIMIHFYPPGYSGPVLSHKYTVEANVDDFIPPGYREFPNIPGREAFVVSHAKYYSQLGYPIPESWDLSRPVSNTAVPPTLSLGRATLLSFTGSEWVFSRFLVDSFRVSFTVTAQALTPGLEIVLVVMKSFKPTLANYLGIDDVPDASNIYSVKIDYPVTGAFYYIGLYAAQRKLTVSTALGGAALVGADVALRVSTEVGQETFPEKTTLQSYFVQFNLLNGLTYSFYTIDVPADARDISISVTRLNAGSQTDIIASNVEAYPTNGKFSPDKLGKGWWRSEAASGDGQSLIIRNFDEGYKSPATYNIGVFAISRSNYFILVRLDRPPPTIKVSRLARGQVAASAFTNFRFTPGLPVASKMYVIIKQAPPTTKGLRIYMKQNIVPTLTDYDSVSDVSDNIGNYVVSIDRPQPNALIYVGVFGVDLKLIPTGENYYFSIEVITDQAFKNYVPAAYIGYTSLAAVDPNAPPQSSTYTPLHPEKLLKGTLARNSTDYYRIQIAESTVISLRSTDNSSYLSLYTREIKLPNPSASGAGGSGNSINNGEFVYKVCAKLDNSTGQVRTVPARMGISGSVGGCGRGGDLSLTLSPSDLQDKSYFFYLAVHFPGCTNRTDSCPLSATYSIIASRSARTDPPTVFGNKSINISGAIVFPGTSTQRYVTPVGSNMSYYFSLKVTKGQVDMLASATSPFPDASMADLPPRHRSLDAFENPPIAFHPDEKPLSTPNDPVYLSLSTSSKAGASYTLTFLALPPAGHIFLSRPVNGRVSDPVFTNIFTGWARAYYRITPTSFGWRGWESWSQTRVILRPTNPKCSGQPCIRKQCCSGANPFGFFDLVTQRGTVPSITSPASGFLPSPLSWMTGPNTDCVKRSNCTMGATPGSAPNQHCEGKCESTRGVKGSTCCEQFTTYTLYLKADEVRNFTQTLYIAVQGRANLTERRTDTFEIELAPALPEVGNDVSANADERFMVGESGPPGDGGGARIETFTPGVDVEDRVGWGEWRLFEWIPQASGVLKATVTQHVGDFGLRIIASKDTRPGSLRDQAGTCAARNGSSCTVPNTADVETSQDGMDTQVGSKYGDGSDPTRGSSASFQIRVTTLKRVTIAVFGSSPVYSPYSFSLSTAFEQNLHAAVGYICQDVNLTGTLVGRLDAGSYAMLKTPPVPADFDLFVTAYPVLDATHGRCAGGGFGGNETVPCIPKTENWTGMGDRALSSTPCKGCWSEDGFDYPGDVTYKNFQFAYFNTAGVTQTRCFVNFDWVYYSTIIFRTTSPFMTLNVTAPPPGGVCEQQVTSYTQPRSEHRPLPNYIASSKEECCDRCQREPTCSYWTLRSELCWKCYDQDLPIDAVTVSPLTPVKWLDNTNSSWIGDVGMKLSTGPRCNQSVAMCCTMRNMTVAQKNRVRTNASSTTTSGSVGLCRTTANGHVGMLVSSSLPCSQMTTASKGASIPWEGQGRAPENDYDARQYWMTDGFPSVCVETWDGSEVFGTTTTPAGSLSCRRRSNATLSIATPDESGKARCLGVKVDAWFFTSGKAASSLAAPYNVSNLTAVMHECNTKVFRTMTNSSNPNATEVFLDSNQTSKKFLNEWDLQADGTLRLRLSIDACLAFGYQSVPKNATFYPGIVKLATFATLTTCNYSRSEKQLWSFRPGGSIQFTWQGAVQGCMSVYANCSKYSSLWNNYCTMIQATPMVSLLPCAPRLPSTLPLVAASSHPSFVPNVSYVISTYGILPSTYSLAWTARRGDAKVVPGGLYGASLNNASINSASGLLSGKCFRLSHDATQDGYTAYVYQRGATPVSLIVTSRRGVCSLPAENTAPSPKGGVGSARPYVLPFRTDAIAVLAKKGGNEDVTCLCVSVQTQPAPPAEAWPVYVTLQIWPQENLAGEPASSLPPWTVAEGGAVDDGWLTPGERVEVTLERGSNASWMMYVREALVVTAHVINGQGIAADLYIGNKYGYAPWGQGGGVLSVYAEDGPLLTVWLVANFTNATNQTRADMVVSLTTAARFQSGRESNSTMLQIPGKDGKSISVLVAERVGARRLSYLTVGAPIGYTTILSVSRNEGAADVVVSPAGGDLPSRSAPPAGGGRSDAINSYPDVILEGREEGYVVGVFADVRANVTLKAVSMAFPREMQYGSKLKIAMQPGETRLFRFKHDVLASPSVLFQLRLTSPVPLNVTECPVTLAVRDNLPPTPSQPGLASPTYASPIDVLARSFTATSFVIAISRCFPAHMGADCLPIVGGPCASGGAWHANCTAGSPPEATGGACEFEFVATTP